jgi:hypothetical protein
VGDERRFYEGHVGGARRSAPAALRNREPIAQVLSQWLPASDLVLEIASGTGEHAAYFAERFPSIEWQPTDVHPEALSSIEGWRQESGCRNLRPPLVLNAASPDWPIERADAVLSINMVHISPWASALGLLDGAARILGPGAPLILYGPWIQDGVATEASNLDFDSSLKARDPEWGLRKVEDFQLEAVKRGFVLEQLRTMPANNLMLLFRFGDCDPFKGDNEALRGP